MSKLSSPKERAYEFPAWCQMETVLDAYQQARAAYLENEAKKLGIEVERQMQQFNNAAETLIKGTQELTGIDGIEVFMGLPNDKEFPSSDLLDEHICITFGWEAMEMLSTARERFWGLLSVLKENDSLSSKGKAFLRRVARCYLFGFDSECIVMCRAVLDAEFKKVSKTGCLCQKIKEAYNSGLINKNTKQAAVKVRKDGNYAIHDKPSDSDPLDCILKTVQILNELAKN